MNDRYRMDLLPEKSKSEFEALVRCVEDDQLVRQRLLQAYGLGRRDAYRELDLEKQALIRLAEKHELKERESGTSHDNDNG